MDSRFESQFYLDEIEQYAPRQSVTVVWGVTGFAQAGERPEVCENCGHPIRNLFFIASNTGARMTVGSECVKSLCDGEARATADKLERRATRAAGQWRKNKPARRDGETRQGYIARRVSEMGNALKAHKAWSAMPSVVNFGRTDRRRIAVNARARRLFGIHVEHGNGYYAENNTPFGWRDLFNADLRRIERKYRANQYDFNRATWDVRKI